jgi:hypothetical protein
MFCQQPNATQRKGLSNIQTRMVVITEQIGRLLKKTTERRIVFKYGVPKHIKAAETEIICRENMFQRHVGAFSYDMDSVALCLDSYTRTFLTV